MAVCTTNLGLTPCRQDPHDPEALRFGLQMLNKVIAILGQMKLGGRQLRNDLGAPIKNDQGAIIRVPWSIGPGEDLQGLWADTSAGVLPPGVIVVWSGYESNVPDGFALCDGNNGTPDMRSKFVLGAAGGAIGTTGGFSRHGAGINDHTDHDPPSGHSGTITVTVDNHTDSLSHTGLIGSHTDLLSHTGLIDNHQDELSHDGLIANHIEDIPHTQLNDHYPHVHDKGLWAHGIDGLDGFFPNATPPVVPDPLVITDSGGDTMDFGSGEFIGPGNTEQEDHPLTHGVIAHTAMNLIHYTDPHVLDLVHSTIPHALYLEHSTNPHVLDLGHSVSGGDYSLSHTFSGDHSGTDNRGPFMLLCWIMKLAEGHQVLPHTPFS